MDLQENSFHMRSMAEKLLRVRHQIGRRNRELACSSRDMLVEFHLLSLDRDIQDGSKFPPIMPNHAMYVCDVNIRKIYGDHIPPLYSLSIHGNFHFQPHLGCLCL